MTNSFFSRSTFVVEQTRKLFEMRNQYRIFDETGTEIATVEQVRQSWLTLLARFGTDLDAVLPTSLEFRDSAGQLLAEMHKPWFTYTFAVANGEGTALGSIRKQLRMGKARFVITDPQGTELGEVRADNWRAKDFTALDQAGNEVAKTAKQWRGLATEMFTDADTYVVSVQPYATEPMRTLSVAAALSIDVVMKQKD